MPSAVDSAHEMGGRVTTGRKPGHLVHGPYVKIAEEGRYSAELSYLTRSCPGQRAGVFDVTISQFDEADNLVDFRTLGSVDLPDTEGNMGEVRLDFDTTGHLGCVLEMRVFVEKDVKMNAFHIRTWRD